MTALDNLRQVFGKRVIAPTAAGADSYCLPDDEELLGLCAKVVEEAYYKKPGFHSVRGLGWFLHGLLEASDDSTR